MARVSIGMICLQSEAGMVFGQAMKVEEQKLLFEADALISVGDELAWRLELVGWERTVAGFLEIRRKDRVPGEPVSLFRARISDMEEEDREAFNQWLGERRDGGTARTVDRHADSVLLSFTQAGMSGATHEQREFALKRMQDRRDLARKRRHALSDRSAEPLSEDTEMGMSQEVLSSEGATRRGRGALRGVLKKGLDLPGGSMSSSAPASAETVTLRERVAIMRQRLEHGQGDEAWQTSGGSRSLPAPDVFDQWRRRQAAAREAEAGQGASPGEGLEPRAPSVAEEGPVVPEAPSAILPAVVALQADSTDRVVVTWPDQMSFRTDFDSHLQWNGLKIPSLHPWGVYTPLLLTLVHPTGDRVEIRARVVATFGEETALEIELFGEERAKIRDWAGL